MENVLTYMTFIPLAGAAVVLVLPNNAKLIRWVAAAATVPPLYLAIWSVQPFRPHHRRVPVRRKISVDPDVQHQLLHGRRRPQYLDGVADRAFEFPLHLRFVRHR